MGKINKVFKNDKFICVTHGNNELFPTELEYNSVGTLIIVKTLQLPK